MLPHLAKMKSLPKNNPLSVFIFHYLFYSVYSSHSVSIYISLFDSIALFCPRVHCFYSVCLSRALGREAPFGLTWRLSRRLGGLGLFEASRRGLQAGLKTSRRFFAGKPLKPGCTNETRPSGTRSSSDWRRPRRHTVHPASQIGPSPPAPPPRIHAERPEPSRNVNAKKTLFFRLLCRSVSLSLLLFKPRSSLAVSLSLARSSTGLHSPRRAPSINPCREFSIEPFSFVLSPPLCRSLTRQKSRFFRPIAVDLTACFALCLLFARLCCLSGCEADLGVFFRWTICLRVASAQFDCLRDTWLGLGHRLPGRPTNSVADPLTCATSADFPTWFARPPNPTTLATAGVWPGLAASQASGGAMNQYSS
ncbi:unnamed protein product [Protopolystoma xenopodis]|uniref:Transmembrane protein n=1 Tax=Protopolystoma xenopodis TaxID=117903 RepID=A0A448XRD1_9PLAT|nr:unnamed protein product [Protopolystoma xenopodis]